MKDNKILNKGLLQNCQTQILNIAQNENQTFLEASNNIWDLIDSAKKDIQGTSLAERVVLLDLGDYMLIDKAKWKKWFGE